MRQPHQSPQEHRGLIRAPTRAQRPHQSPQEHRGLIRAPTRAQRLHQGPQEHRGLIRAPTRAQRPHQSTHKSTEASSEPTRAQRLHQSPQEHRGLIRASSEPTRTRVQVGQRDCVVFKGPLAAQMTHGHVYLPASPRSYWLVNAPGSQLLTSAFALASCSLIVLVLKPALSS